MEVMNTQNLKTLPFKQSNHKDYSEYINYDGCFPPSLIIWRSEIKRLQNHWANLVDFD